MEKKLNTQDGWEAIVNAPERQKRIDALYAGRKQARIDRLGHKAGTCAFGTLILGALYLLGAVSGWVALPVGVALAGMSLFTFGRVAELKKVRG